MKGYCLCRAVSLAVASAPEYVNACNCRLCRSSGAAWGYYQPEEVTVTGATSAFRRDDLGHEPLSEVHFCPRCGSTTHFLVTHPEHQGIGVNTRIFDQDDLEGLDMRYYDSRNFSRDGGEAKLTGTGKISDGRTF